MAFLADKYKIIYFGNLKKENEQKEIEKVNCTSYESLRFHKTDPFFHFHILSADGFFDGKTLLFEVCLMQPS